MSHVWKKLLDGMGAPSSKWVAIICGTISALAMPLFLTLTGWFMQLLFVSPTNAQGKRVLPEVLELGNTFRIQTSWLSSESNLLRSALTLIVWMMVVFVIERLALLLTRRSAFHAGLWWTSRLLRQLFSQSHALSVDHGLAGQRKNLRDLIQSDTPRVRDALTDWYRVFPRNAVQSAAVVLLACLIHPWLTLFSILALAAIWGLYSALESSSRKGRPVWMEQRRNSHEQLLYLCESSPMLESLDERVDVSSLYDNQINNYNESHQHIADEGILRSPFLLLSTTLLGGLLLFVLAVRVFEPGSTLRVGELVVMLGCAIVAVNGLFRLRRGLRKKQNAINAATRLLEYINITPYRSSGIGEKVPPSHRGAVVLEHVCFRDSTKKKLLDDVSLTLSPGLLTAVVSMEEATAEALGEMVLGFGYPSSGRVLIGALNLVDIDTESIRRNSLMINDRGPLLDGTVEENLWSGKTKNATIDVMDLTRRVHVAEAILNLPDGLGTVVSSSDDRLPPDQLFRIGVVRALIKNPSLVVAHEPKIRVSIKEEIESLDALQQLKASGATVVVLPERLSTLRAADRIIVLSDGKLVGTGTHQELLQSSEIYRHFNYIRFALSN